METSEKEIARRVLTAVLERLNGDARADSDSKASATADDLHLEQAQLSNCRNSSLAENAGPIIFIVVNQELSANDLHERSSTHDRTAGPNPSLLNGDKSEARGLHPGLEKFPIAGDNPAVSAPKDCFMEPGRVCINSGACEMRGY